MKLNMKNTRLKKYFYPLALILITIPFSFWIARHPQNPDGAEMFMNALYGGVLHPPGFPLQAWINRLLFSITSSNSPITLSFFSFFCHTISVVLIYCISLRFKNSEISSFISGLIYSTYPLIMGMALQPEKYALAQTMMLCVILFSISSYEDIHYRKSIILMSIFSGLAIAQHPVIITAFPFWMSAIFYNLYQKRITASFFGLNVLISLFLIAFFYASLPLLRNDSTVWPDWGNLKTISDSMHHLLRKDLGGLSLYIGTHEEKYFSGIAFLCLDFPRSFHVYSVLFLCVIVSIWKKHKTQAVIIAVSLMIQMALLFLLKNFVSDVSYGVMERYLIFIYLLLFITLGSGIELIIELSKSKKVKLIMIALLLIIVTVNTARHGSFFRAMTNDFVPIYLNNIAHALTQDDIYISGSDFETLYGVPGINKTRFPVVNLFQFPWYMSHVLPELDYRFKPILYSMQMTIQGNFFYFLKYISKNNYPVVCTSGTVLKNLNREILRRGLLFVINENNKKSFNLDLAVRLCSDLQKIEINIPNKSHYFIKDLIERLSLVFYDVSRNNSYSMNLRSIADDVFTSLKPGIDADVIRNTCTAFIQEVNRHQ